MAERNGDQAARGPAADESAVMAGMKLVVIGVAMMTIAAVLGGFN